MAFARNHIKVFVSSTVYDFEWQLDRIYSILDNWGYDVLMSHKGTIPLDSSKSNLQNCVDAVTGCDVFLGFIRPLLGSGAVGDGGKTITELEFEEAYLVDMPRFVLADYRVVEAMQLLNLLDMPSSRLSKLVQKTNSKGEAYTKENHLVHGDCIEMYNMAIKNNEPPQKRVGNWVQTYKTPEEIDLHLEAQFKDVNRVVKLIEVRKNG